MQVSRASKIPLFFIPQLEGRTRDRHRYSFAAAEVRLRTTALLRSACMSVGVFFCKRVLLSMLSEQRKRSKNLDQNTKDVAEQDEYETSLTY